MTNGTKFLSIVTRMSLADQHSKSLQSIHMHNYQDTQGSLCDVKSLVICLNSLHKLKELSDEEMSKYIVYVDEVSSFAEFTNNDLLDNIMKHTVATLTSFLRLAHKVRRPPWGSLACEVYLPSPYPSLHRGSTGASRTPPPDPGGGEGGQIRTKIPP